MDKKYYKPTEEKYQELAEEKSRFIKKFSEELEGRGIIQRHRKIKQAGTLAIAAFHLIVKNLSFRRLSIEMASKYEIKMTGTAWEKQLMKSGEIIKKVAEEICQMKGREKSQEKAEKAEKTEKTLKARKKPKTIYLVDATNISEAGKKGASIRLHCSYNLKRQDIDEIHISDWHKGESMCNFTIHPDGLYIADRAYGKAKQMAYVLENKGNFLFRITPNNICLYADSKCENKVSFPEMLRNTKYTKLDFSCFFKYNKKTYPVRVKALKIPTNKLEKVERKQKRKQQKKQYKSSENTALFNEWVILVTSLGEKYMRFFHMYTKRWQIELLFKRSKTFFCFRKIRYSSQRYAYTMTYLWSAMILIASHLASRSTLHLFDFFSLFASSFA